MTTSPPSPAPPRPDECGVIELRQYTLRPGGRDALIRLFEREFVESQERTGMCLLGLFRDLDRDDRFVWVRGFRDMVERKEALTTFYGGPIWKANSKAANETMVDVDDVLLLRPLAPLSLPEAPVAPRPVVAAIAHVVSPDTTDAVADALVASTRSAEWSAVLATLSAENTFPALPIREDADVVVVLAAGGQVTAGDEQLHLAPTARSALR